MQGIGRDTPRLVLRRRRIQRGGAALNL